MHWSACRPLETVRGPAPPSSKRLPCGAPSRQGVNGADLDTWTTTLPPVPKPPSVPSHSLPRLRNVQHFAAGLMDMTDSQSNNQHSNACTCQSFPRAGGWVLRKSQRPTMLLPSCRRILPTCIAFVIDRRPTGAHWGTHIGSPHNILVFCCS